MLGMRYIKVPPTTYLMQFKNGKVVREGLGLSFFYFAPASTLVAVPVGSRDVPFIFTETTADFQEVTVQGHLTCRVADPKKLAAVLDHSLKPVGGYATDDPDKLASRVTHAAQTATRAEYGPDPRSAQPAEWRVYAYVIHLGPTEEEGPNLVLRTSTEMGGDYELNKAVLDRIVATLELIGTVQ